MIIKVQTVISGAIQWPSHATCTSYKLRIVVSIILIRWDSVQYNHAPLIVILFQNFQDKQRLRIVIYKANYKFSSLELYNGLCNFGCVMII